MKSKRAILFLILPLLATGCATMKDSMLAGASTGLAIGAGVGAGANHKRRGDGAAVGALIGAAIGAISGRLVHKKLEERDGDTRKETLFNIDKFGVSGVQDGFSPVGEHGLTMPKVDSEWVPTSVKGKKLVEGHRVWIITEDSQWLPGEGGKKKSK